MVCIIIYLFHKFNKHSYEAGSVGLLNEKSKFSLHTIRSVGIIYTFESEYIDNGKTEK